MALSEAAIAAIGAGAAAAASTAGGIGSVALANRRQYKNWLKTHNIQREEYLSDREYNSPAAQMQRYKDAGLNPHLIYGQDNTTSMMSQQSAPPIESSAREVSSGLQRIADSFRLYNDVLNSQKQRELADSNILANEAKEKYYNNMAEFTDTKNSMENLKLSSFDKNNYWDEYVRKAVFGNQILDLNQKFLERTLMNRVKQVDSLLRWYDLRNESQNIENIWNKPKSLLPQSDLFNMWKNISDQKGWLKSHLMTSQRDLNNASVGAKVAQTLLYESRAGFTDTKNWFIPLEWLVRAGLLFLK